MTLSSKISSDWFRISTTFDGFDLPYSLLLYILDKFSSLLLDLLHLISYRETILRYFKAVEELARDIGVKLVEALGLDIPEFMQGWPCQFRLLKYHFTPESVGSNGARMHSDLSYLTILQDDESVGGLELVDKKSGEMIDVEPSPPGTLLVVLGDIAKV